MNSKQIYKNQDLFSFVFLDEEFNNSNQFKLQIGSNFKESISEQLKEAPNPPDVDVYGEYELSIQVGKTFFYFAFINVFPYQKRLDFLNYQLEQSKDKMAFLHRVEALSQVDYWYMFGEFSYYNPETEKVVADWLVAKFKGAPDPKPLNLIKP